MGYFGVMTRLRLTALLLAVPVVLLGLLIGYVELLAAGASYGLDSAVAVGLPFLGLVCATAAAIMAVLVLPAWKV